MEIAQLGKNKTTAAAVISCLRISINGELKEILGICTKITPLHIEKGVKGKSQQLEKSQVLTSFKLFSHLEPLVAMIREI